MEVAISESIIFSELPGISVPYTHMEGIYKFDGQHDPNCPAVVAMSVIGGKWKIPALYMMLDGPIRPGELQRRLPGVTRQVLTTQLRELELDNVISRREYGEIPPRVEYALTTFGRTLTPILNLLYRWGELHKEVIETGRMESIVSANQETI